MEKTMFSSHYFMFNKRSAVAEMGDTRHGPKRGGIAEHICSAHFAGELGPRLTQCGLSRDLLSCQVASSSIQPFGQIDMNRKLGLCPL